MTPISAASAPGRAPGAAGEVIRPSSLRSRRRRTVGRYTPACKSCAGFRPAKPNGYAPASVLANIKNSLLAAHRAVAAKHLPRYLGAFAWRFNRRFVLKTIHERLAIA